jgi:hypothetical protein
VYDGLVTIGFLAACTMAMAPFVTAASRWLERGAREVRRALSVIVHAAAAEASRRGHEKITAQHALRVLLDVPEIAAAWTRLAWPLAEWRGALDRYLDALPSDGVRRERFALDSIAPSLIDAVRRVEQTTRWSGSPEATRRDALAALVRALGAAGVARAEGIDAGDVRLEAFTMDDAPRRPASAVAPSAGAPYRSAPPAAGAHVFLRNDPRSDFASVLALLTEVAGLSDTRAAYLACALRVYGRTAMASSSLEEATALVHRILADTRSKGLRVSVEAP